jgi:uncharacterized repeat protein (TIGR01451 family)
MSMLHRLVLLAAVGLLALPASAAAAPQISISDSSVIEGNSGQVAMRFVVSISEDPALPVTVDYGTEDGTATAAGGDYVATNGSVGFLPGSAREVEIVVPVNGDAAVEPNEFFSVKLGNLRQVATPPPPEGTEPPPPPEGTPPPATIADGVGDGTIVNDDAIPTAASADVTVAIGSSPEPVRAGQTLTYGITVANAGPNLATDVRLVDALPAGVTFISATGAACTGTTTVNCAIGPLAPGSSLVIFVQVRPAAAGTITNTARVSGSTADPNIANNSASVSNTVTPAPVDPTPSALSFSIAGDTVELTRSQRAPVRLRFGAGASGVVRGTVTVRSRGTFVGKSSYSARAGQTRTVPVRISSRGRRELARRGRLSIRVTVTARDAGGARATRGRSLVLVDRR